MSLDDPRTPYQWAMRAHRDAADNARLLPGETLGDKLRKKLQTIRANAEYAQQSPADLDACVAAILGAIDEAVTWTEQIDREGAVLAGLRLRCDDLEARLAATEAALDERTAATVRAALAPCPTCDDTGGITVAPPGLGGSNSPHARDVACPDCNDHTGGF